MVDLLRYFIKKTKEVFYNFWKELVDFLALKIRPISEDDINDFCDTYRNLRQTGMEERLVSEILLQLARRKLCWQKLRLPVSQTDAEFFFNFLENLRKGGFDRPTRYEIIIELVVFYLVRSGSLKMVSEKDAEYLNGCYRKRMPDNAAGLIKFRREMARIMARTYAKQN